MTDSTDPNDPVQAEIQRAIAFSEQGGGPTQIRKIPEEAIERWTSIPPEAPVVLNLTRGEVDHLYFTLQAMQSSIVGFQMSMTAWTNGNSEAANLYYQGCIGQNGKAANRLTDFMTAVMLRAEPENG